MSLLALVAFPLAAPLAGQPAAQAQSLAFQPKVGAIGTRVKVKAPLPPGTDVRFGTRAVPVLREDDGFSFLVPVGSVTSFVEVVAKGGRVLARSAVPYVVTGTSLVAAPRLIGLKEAIDVFGYADVAPEGVIKPEPTARPVLKLDDQEVLTIGEPDAISHLTPAVSLTDANSMATRSMGPAGFLITARPPIKKYVIPPPSPP